MTPELTIFVAGIPKPQGSMTAGLTRDGRAFVRHARPQSLDAWRNMISEAIWAEIVDTDPFDKIFPLSGPLGLNATFYLPRPKSHYLRSGTLRPDAPEYHAMTPDKDKLERALNDAITKGGAWHDDKQVATGTVSKKYIQENGVPGVAFTIYRV